MKEQTEEQIKAEVKQVEHEEKAKKARDLAKKARKSLIYIGIIWVICSTILLLTTSSPLVVLVILIAGAPLILFIAETLVEYITEKKSSPSKQKFADENRHLKAQADNEEGLEEVLPTKKDADTK